MTVLKTTDLDLKGKCVLIHEGLNVPVKDGQVQSDTRIKAALPILKLTLGKDVAVTVYSHLGCPAEGEFSTENSPKPVAEYLSKTLGREVPLLISHLDGVEVRAGGLVLFENVRFNKGEKRNADESVQKYATLCGMLMMDAFSTAHRAEGSTRDIARFAKIITADPLLVTELDVLSKALDSPVWPMAVIVADSKVSTKPDMLNSPAGICDRLIVSGGIANTFFAVVEYKVSKSLYEADLVETAKIIAAKIKVPLPVDVAVARGFVESVVATVKVVAEVADDNTILDTGPQTVAQFAGLLKISKTILRNGPVGVFEFNQLGEGTRTLANATADSTTFSIVGGGGTLAAINKYGIAERISHIFTGGGAFFEFVEGKVLPAVEILEQRAEG